MMRGGGEGLPRRYGSGERAPSPLTPCRLRRAGSYAPSPSLRERAGVRVAGCGSALGARDGLGVGGGDAERGLELAREVGLVGEACGEGDVGRRFVVV